MSDEAKCKAGNKAKALEVLTSALPPFHSVAFVGICTAVFVKFLPSIENLDESATIETFTTIVFPEYVGLRTLALIRGAIAAMIFLTTYSSVSSPGIEMTTPYQPTSRLVSKPFRLKGIRTTFTFTSVAWNLLGCAFAFNSYVALAVSTAKNGTTNEDPSGGDGGLLMNPWFLRIGLCLWEISAPFTLMVSAVVRYVIWPSLLTDRRLHESAAAIAKPRPLLMHNANLVAALAETSLLGGLPVLPGHCCLAPLVGIAYVLFTWYMAMRWAPDRGPQFVYYFFDTTVPGYQPTATIGVLLLVLFSSYGVFCAAERVLESMGGGLPVHVGFVVIVASLLVKFRD